MFETLSEGRRKPTGKKKTAEPDHLQQCQAPQHSGGLHHGLSELIELLTERNHTLMLDVSGNVLPPSITICAPVI